MEYEFTVGGTKHRVRTDARSPVASVTVDDRTYDVDWSRAADGAISLVIDGRSHTALVARRDGGVLVWVDGAQFAVDAGVGADAGVSAVGTGSGRGGSIKAPMPGTVVKVSVKEGESVSAGQSLIVVEAMKMENDVRSPVDGIVSKVNVAPGDSVGTTEAMVEIEPAEAG